MNKRFWQRIRHGLGRFWLGLFLAIVVAALWQTAAFAKAPAQIRVGQFISEANLSVQIQAQSGNDEAVMLSDLPYKQISAYQALPAGRYRLTVRSEDRTLLTATYGLGGSDRYTLALFGIPPEQAETNPHTFMAQLKHIFGGVDAHSVNGYLPQMRLLSDKVSSQSDAPQVRLVHMAPGVVSLQMNIRGQSQSLLSRSLTYPCASDAAAVKGGEAIEVAIATPEGTAATSPVPLQLKAKTLTDIFVIGGLNAPQPLEIVVAEAQ